MKSFLIIYYTKINFLPYEIIISVFTELSRPEIQFKTKILAAFFKSYFDLSENEKRKISSYFQNKCTNQSRIYEQK